MPEATSAKPPSPGGQHLVAFGDQWGQRGRKEVALALYLTHFSYTPESWMGLVSHPRDRREELRPFIEAAGARLIDMYFTFGKEDGVLLTEGDNVSAAAISIAATAAGGIKSIETQVLLTVDEMLEALDKAAELPYRAPKEAPVHA